MFSIQLHMPFDRASKQHDDSVVFAHTSSLQWGVRCLLNSIELIEATRVIHKNPVQLTLI